MKKMNYKPQPVDTSKVSIPSDLMILSERVAKNTHDVWAEGRISDGWTWGPVRDDVKKQHPCLVPYEELSEQEKGYDRRTSIETIKLILSLGYEITCVLEI